MLKSGRGLAILLLVFFALITDSNIATADNQLLFDTNLTIGDWQVHASQHSFSAEEARKARIKISKNTPDKQIQHAFFVLNGAFTFLRDFFIGDERVFEKDVTLSASNTLILVLLGEPGAEIAVQAIEKDAPAPAPEITAFAIEPFTIKRGQSATLTWQTVNADTCTIEPGIGAVDTSGSLSVTPTDTITYVLTAEGTGTPATAAVTVTIENSAPVADPQSVSTDEDVALAITLTASDLDGDGLTYSISAQPVSGTLSGAPPNLTYTPNADFNGSDSFTYTADDGMHQSEPATVTIEVAAIDNALPEAADDNYTVLEGETLVVTSAEGLLANDADADLDPLSSVLVNAPRHRPAMAPSRPSKRSLCTRDRGTGKGAASGGAEKQAGGSLNSPAPGSSGPPGVPGSRGAGAGSASSASPGSPGNCPCPSRPKSGKRTV